MTLMYYRGDELPAFVGEVTENGKETDFSSGYTFEVKIADSTGTVVLTKTAGISGSLGEITVEWATSELDLAPGSYTVQLRFVRQADGYDETHQTPMKIKAKF